MLYRLDGSSKTAAIGLSRGGVEDLIDSKVQAALKSYDETRLPRQVWYSATGETPELSSDVSKTNGVYLFHFAARETDHTAGVGEICWNILHDEVKSRNAVTFALADNNTMAYKKYNTPDFTNDELIKGGAFDLASNGGDEALVDGILNHYNSWIDIKWTSATCWYQFALNSGYVKFQIDNDNKNHPFNGLNAGQLYVYDGKTNSNSVYELTVWKLTDHTTY